jgi:hypothetical protein
MAGIIAGTPAHLGIFTKLSRRLVAGSFAATQGAGFVVGWVVGLAAGMAPYMGRYR